MSRSSDKPMTLLRKKQRMTIAKDSRSNRSTANGQQSRNPRGSRTDERAERGRVRVPILSSRTPRLLSNEDLVARATGSIVTGIVKAESWSRKMATSAIEYIRGLSSTYPHVMREADKKAQGEMNAEALDSIRKAFAASCYDVATEYGNFLLPAMNQPWFAPLRDAHLADVRKVSTRAEAPTRR